jgi:dCMP deaminase
VDTDISYWQSFMIDSYRQALKSPDPSTQNGAVLINSNGYISYGYNSFPDGVSNDYFLGEKEAKYARVCHAEVSAIMDAARHGIATERSTLVCGWAACSNCAKYMARAGLIRLIRHAYNDSTTGQHWFADCQIGDEILKDAGIEIIEIAPVRWDGTLRRDGKPWRPEILTTA